MHTLGKTLQILGLILLPLSMFFEMTGGLGRAIGVSDMLIMLIVGATLFVLGRFIEGYAQR